MQENRRGLGPKENSHPRDVICHLLNKAMQSRPVSFPSNQMTDRWNDLSVNVVLISEVGWVFCLVAHNFIPFILPVPHSMKRAPAAISLGQAWAKPQPGPTQNYKWAMEYISNIRVNTAGKSQAGKLHWNILKQVAKLFNLRLVVGSSIGHKPKSFPSALSDWMLAKLRNQRAFQINELDLCSLLTLGSIVLFSWVWMEDGNKAVLLMTSCVFIRFFLDHLSLCKWKWSTEI